MPDENNIEEQQTPEQKPEMDANEYLKNIQELKDTTVSKELYEKLKKENEILAKNAINNIPVSNEPQLSEAEISAANRKRMDELRKELYANNDSEMTNLDYITKTLELRDLVIKEDGYDPMVNQYLTKAEDQQYELEGVNRTVKAYKDLIEKSEGDPNVFEALLESNTTVIGAKPTTTQKRR